MYDARIAYSRGPWIVGFSKELRIHIVGEPGIPANDWVQAPTICQTLGAACPSVGKRKIPASAQGNALSNIEIGRCAEQISLEKWNLRVAVPESRGVINRVCPSVRKDERSISQ